MYRQAYSFIRWYSITVRHCGIAKTHAMPYHVWKSRSPESAFKTFEIANCERRHFTSTDAKMKETILCRSAAAHIALSSRDQPTSATKRPPEALLLPAPAITSLGVISCLRSQFTPREIATMS